MKGSYQSSHPLHLLDDLLASLPPGDGSTIREVKDQSKIESSPNNAFASENATAMAETNQDVVLRAACDLFGNNMSLLENALALLDDQKQYQTSTRIEIANGRTTPTVTPVIRKIRARRSGREAVLVQKQHKKSTSGRKPYIAGGNPSSGGNTDDKGGGNQNSPHHYYLCLLGRDRVDRRALLAESRGRSNVHRQGAHCTCRSFLQNIKGGSRSPSSAKSGEANPQRTCPNAVVCKHLLAAILMPHMLPWSGSGGMEDEIVDDSEFAKLIMRASIG